MKILTTTNGYAYIVGTSSANLIAASTSTRGVNLLSIQGAKMSILGGKVTVQ